MQYEEFVQAVRKLDFVPDDETAGNMVKAVLGVLASRAEEPQARELTESLPEPLTYERLRSHQVGTSPTPAGNYFDVIADQFNISTDQAAAVIQEVLHVTRQALPQEKRQDLGAHLPQDWAALFAAA